ncbi:hypothetical protein DFH08DRAFT_439488 [Mycena albidolilacea]|uniref:Uncharacterized protein n=1 Tax=Mycena albidolilacea TaxID=1033008 RepID=A0AAD7AGH2_9AGAR|nr:hypothetical protein DFH08DRAFT_439488 [Mycena albidolilacea]
MNLLCREKFWRFLCVLSGLIEADRGLGMDGYNALQSRSHCFESSVLTLSVAFASSSRCKNSYSFSFFAVTSPMIVHIVQ